MLIYCKSNPNGALVCYLKAVSQRVKVVHVLLVLYISLVTIFHWSDAGRLFLKKENKHSCGGIIEHH